MDYYIYSCNSERNVDILFESIVLFGENIIFFDSWVRSSNSPWTKVKSVSRTTHCDVTQTEEMADFPVYSYR
jgi:hypothetical protein